MSSVTSAIGPVLLATLVMALIGCTHSPSPNAVKPIILKAKKPVQHPLSAEVTDNQYDIDYYGTSSLNRNLPLAGTTWEWEDESRPLDFNALNDSSVYMLEFKSNGWFEILADCRRGTGMYESDAGHIALTLIKLSHSTCNRDSRADDFLRALEAARAYRLSDGKLFFDIKHETKPLVFHLKP